MPGPALYILAIMGCGEADAPCEQVQIAPLRYQSEAACMAASDDMIARADAPYPVVVAECRRAGARTVALRADDIRRPAPNGVIGRLSTAAR